MSNLLLLLGVSRPSRHLPFMQSLCNWSREKTHQQHMTTSTNLKVGEGAIGKKNTRSKRDLEWEEQDVVLTPTRWSTLDIEAREKESSVHIITSISHHDNIIMILSCQLVVFFTRSFPCQWPISNNRQRHGRVPKRPHWLQRQTTSCRWVVSAM